nr:MAG TPA: hypothetical protein [Caudoviricetes sp.]
MNLLSESISRGFHTSLTEVLPLKPSHTCREERN